MFQEGQGPHLIQGALLGQGGPSHQGLQLGLGCPGCQGDQSTPQDLLGQAAPPLAYQVPALQAPPSLPSAPGVHGQRLLSGLSPQRGQGQAPSPHDNRPHSHRCNRRALLGGLCHPPHIPLPGTCRLWRGPGDLSAPPQGLAKGLAPGFLPLHLELGTGNQGSSPQSSHRNRGARSHSRETQWAVAGAPGFGAYEVLMAAALEISGLCETVVSEVSPSKPPHNPAPSVHRIHRQLAPPEQ